jgi:hypothetical protein
MGQNGQVLLPKLFVKWWWAGDRVGMERMKGMVSDKANSKEK